jgi:hypothetical protein
MAFARKGRRASLHYLEEVDMRKTLIAGIGSGLALALASTVAAGFPGSVPPAHETASVVALTRYGGHGGMDMGHAMGHPMGHVMGHAMVGHSMHLHAGPRLAFRSHGFPHHHHHHRHFFIAAVPYFYDDDYGYYDGGCGWLYRRAIATGSSYWWRRYRACLY